MSTASQLAAANLTQAQALAFILANVTNPSAIFNAARKTGLDTTSLSEVSGYAQTLVSSFFTANGLDSTLLDNVTTFSATTTDSTTVTNAEKLRYTAANNDITLVIDGANTNDVVDMVLTQSQASITLTGIEKARTYLASDATTVTIDALYLNQNTIALSGTNALRINNIYTGGTIDASGLSGTAELYVSDSVTVLAGNNNVTLTSSGTTTDTAFTGSNANDTIDVALTSGTLIAALGAGNNTVTANAITSGSLSITGGAGNDTVSATAGTLSSGNVNLNLGDGTNSVALSFTDAADAIAQVTVITGKGNDTVTLGAGLGVGDIVTLTLGTGTNVVTLGANADLSTATLTLSGVSQFQLTDDADNDVATYSATVKAADFSGKKYIIKGTSSATDSLKVVGAATTTSIDCSTLTFDNSASYAISVFSIDGSLATAKQTIKATAMRDVILGGTVDDVITAGNGADDITGGKGNDSIILTETTASADNVIFNSSIATDPAPNGIDTITAFSAGAGIDIATLLATDTTASSEAGIATFETISVALTNTATTTYDIGMGENSLSTNTADVIELQVTLSTMGDITKSTATDGTELFKALSSTATATTALTLDTAGDMFYLIAYQKGNAYLYYVSDDDASATATATEVSLVGIFKTISIGSFATGDFYVG